uniref:Uncharacterized protein n=2 Tax=Ixodes ricinus TaxID=34613 RepID=A0A0K8RLD8_IXORI
MSTRFHMDYVLVKVERGSEESSRHNILMELPATLTNPTVSVACCYFDKCSRPVSAMVQTKSEGAKDSPRIPAILRRYRLPQRKRQGRQ